MIGTKTFQLSCIMYINSSRPTACLYIYIYKLVVELIFILLVGVNALDSFFFYIYMYINPMSLVLFINNMITDRIISMPIDLVCSFSLCNSPVNGNHLLRRFYLFRCLYKQDIFFYFIHIHNRHSEQCKYTYIL